MSPLVYSLQLVHVLATCENSMHMLGVCVFIIVLLCTSILSIKVEGMVDVELAVAMKMT